MEAIWVFSRYQARDGFTKKSGERARVKVRNFLTGESKCSSVRH